jgi:hypothetical protein
MGVGGKGKNFFSREKKLFPFPPNPLSLFQKKAAYFVKWRAAPVGDHLPVQGTEPFKKSGVFVKSEMEISLRKNRETPCF